MPGREDERFLKAKVDELTEHTTRALLVSQLAVASFVEQGRSDDPHRLHALVDSIITSLSDEERAQLFG